MLGEEGGENFERFAGGAWLSLAVSNLITVILCSIILFPLLVLLPLTILLTLWFSREYITKFRFMLNKTNLFVRRGVITYAYTLIPYENIQDVHVVQGYADRLFGVWSVSIFTATATARGSETVPGLSRDGAENLRSAIFSKIKEARYVTD